MGCDAFDMLDDYYTAIPVKFEPNFVSDRSARRDQYEYWSWLLALVYQADHVDAAMPWYCSDAFSGNTDTSNVLVMGQRLRPD